VQLKQLKHLALDLDGTLYLGGRVFEFTRDFLETLRRLGIGRTFFTNNSSKSTKQYVEKLRAMGINANAEEIYSSTLCTIEYLRMQRPEVRRVYVLGTPALRGEFAEAAFDVAGEAHDDEPNAVIVGFDTSLVYEHLCRAAWWLSKGKPFIATHCDRICPTDLPTVLPDCAAICAMLTSATGREPEMVLGKPHPMMLQAVMRRHGLKANEIGVVGDRLYTDIAMARSAGAMGILVLSGETTAQQARAANPGPDLIVENVGELAPLLEREKQ
jgi:HAD superfamily hydrolase (TIGR01450 family)